MAEEAIRCVGRGRCDGGRGCGRVCLPGAVAVGSSSASGREGRSSSVDIAHALAVGRDGKPVVAGLSGKPSEGRRRMALARPPVASSTVVSALAAKCFRALAPRTNLRRVQAATSSRSTALSPRAEWQSTATTGARPSPTITAAAGSGSTTAIVAPSGGPLKTASLQGKSRGVRGSVPFGGRHGLECLFYSSA
jgi:hypothetical protein